MSVGKMHDVRGGQASEIKIRKLIPQIRKIQNIVWDGFIISLKNKF